MSREFLTPVRVPSSSTTESSFRLPHGSAPTAPVNGDMWTTTAGVYARINGATVGPLVASDVSSLTSLTTVGNTGAAQTINGTNVTLNATRVFMGRSAADTTFKLWTDATDAYIADDNTANVYIQGAAGGNLYLGYATGVGAKNIEIGVGSTSATTLTLGTTNASSVINANGKVVTAASTTSRASMTITHGTAPTAPANGDVWTTTSGMYVRINGATVGPLAAATGSPTWGSITGTLSSQTDLQSALNLKAPLASPTFTGTVTAPTIVGTDTTDSTSSTTGALKTAGGLGVAKKLYVGTDASVGGNLTVTGDLTINGTTTTVNSTTLTVDDPIVTLGGDTAPTADDNKDRGVEFRYHNGTTAKVGFFGFDDSTGKFTFIADATNTSEVFSGTKGSIDANFSGSDINTGTVSATYIDSAIARNTGTSDIEITDATKGVILKSPNGTRYRLTVADDGALTTTAL